MQGDIDINLINVLFWSVWKFLWATWKMPFPWDKNIHFIGSDKVHKKLLPSHKGVFRISLILCHPLPQSKRHGVWMVIGLTFNPGSRKFKTRTAGQRSGLEGGFREWHLLLMQGRSSPTALPVFTQKEGIWGLGLRWGEWGQALIIWAVCKCRIGSYLYLNFWCFVHQFWYFKLLHENIICLDGWFLCDSLNFVSKASASP
jgi:hypothetical protein